MHAQRGAMALGALISAERVWDTHRRPGRLGAGAVAAGRPGEHVRQDPGGRSRTASDQWLPVRGQSASSAADLLTEPLRRGHGHVSQRDGSARDAGRDLRAVRSVASFFVSRVDSEVDSRLEEMGTAEALALRGRAAGRRLARRCGDRRRRADRGVRAERLVGHLRRGDPARVRARGRQRSRACRVLELIGTSRSRDDACSGLVDRQR